MNAIDIGLIIVHWLAYRFVPRYCFTSHSNAPVINVSVTCRMSRGQNLAGSSTARAKYFPAADQPAIKAGSGKPLAGIGQYMFVILGSYPTNEIVSVHSKH
jgi:hypothetical protein